VGAGRSISGRPGGCRDTGSTRLRVAPVGYKGPRQGTGPLSYQLLRPVGCPGLAMPRPGAPWGFGRPAARPRRQTPPSAATPGAGASRPQLAASDKCLARNNKSHTGAEATEKRPDNVRRTDQMLRKFFSRKNSWDDATKLKFATAIAGMLERQLLVAGSASIEDEQGYPKRKALGYVYGYIDAALRVKGQDMAISMLKCNTLRGSIGL